MLNCIYDCKYCFLQGMFNSANYLVFVNYDDFFKEIRKKIIENKHKKICFFSGYDCDSLALDNVTNFVSNFINFFRKYKNAFLEIRTKSVKINHLLKIKPISNAIIAYSMNPQNIIKEFEQKTPNLNKRLDSLKKLQDNGWNIGLRFDPIFISKENKNDYFNFIREIFSILDSKLIHSVTIGKFRMPNIFLKKLIKIRPEDSFLFHKFAESSNEEKNLFKLFHQQVNKYVNKKKIFYN